MSRFLFPLPRAKQAVALFQAVYILRPARTRLQREERVHKMRLSGQRRPPSGLDDARRDEAHALLHEALNPLKKAQELLAQDAGHAHEDLRGLRPEERSTSGLRKVSGRGASTASFVEWNPSSRPCATGGASGATPTEADGGEPSVKANGLAVDAGTVSDLDEISFEIPDLALGFEPRAIA